MKTKSWRAIRAQKFSPAALAEIDREVAGELDEMDLRELREAAGKTQDEMAVALHTVQPEISRLEHRDDFHISTLRSYITALGGSLEVVATFGNRRVRLEGPDPNGFGP
jgi:hypothetical protein